DFALNYAGIEKAVAWPGTDAAGAATVRVVVAGDEDVPFDKDSERYLNLRKSFHTYGDPSTRVIVDIAQPVPLVLQASVRIDPRYGWRDVEAGLRAQVFARYGWDARGIGEPAFLSAVLEALQSVAGVVGIDVDVFGPLYEGPDKQVPLRPPAPPPPAP